MVSDAAHGVPDIRDSVFDLPQEDPWRAFTRATRPHASSPGHLPGPDAGHPGTGRQSRGGAPTQQRRCALQLAHDAGLRGACNPVLAGDAVARGLVVPFLRRIPVHLLPPDLLDPDGGLREGSVPSQAASSPAV